MTAEQAIEWCIRRAESLATMRDKQGRFGHARAARELAQDFKTKLADLRREQQTKGA